MACESNKRIGISVSLVYSLHDVTCPTRDLATLELHMYITALRVGGALRLRFTVFWEERRSKLYGDSQSTQQPSVQSLIRDFEDFAGVIGRKGRCRGRGGRQVCGSALYNGCVSSGMSAMAAC